MEPNGIPFVLLTDSILLVLITDSILVLITDSNILILITEITSELFFSYGLFVVALINIPYAL